MTVNVLFLNVIYMLLSNDKLYTSVEMTVNVLLPNEVTVAKTIYRYECKLCIWGKEKIINLYYHTYEKVWYVEM